MNALLISHTTKAITTNVITALRNTPQRIATSSPGHRLRRLEHDLELGKVDAAEEQPNRRHDDVLDERGDHRPERGADDHADRQGQGVGLDEERAEVGQHGHLQEPSWGGPMIPLAAQPTIPDHRRLEPMDHAFVEAMTHRLRAR